MADETLFTASRRLVRFFRIDARVGFLTDETLGAARTLDHEIGRAETGVPHDAGLLKAAKHLSQTLGIDDREHGGSIRIPTQIACDGLDRALACAAASEVVQHG